VLAEEEESSGAAAELTQQHQAQDDNHNRHDDGDDGGRQIGILRVGVLGTIDPVVAARATGTTAVQTFASLLVAFSRNARFQIGVVAIGRTWDAEGSPVAVFAHLAIASCAVGVDAIVAPIVTK
jgi:hypothetical protein